MTILTATGASLAVAAGNMQSDGARRLIARNEETRKTI